MINLKEFYSFNDMVGYSSELSGITINESDTIELSSKHVSGLIKSLWIEEGFSIRYFNLSVKSDLQFECLSENHKDDIVYKLIYTLQKPENNTISFNNKLLFESNQSNNTLLYLPDFTKKVQIIKDASIHQVALLFTGSWLERNFSEASDKIHLMIKDLKAKNKPTVISDFIDSKSFILANEMANEMNKTSFPLIHIKTKSLILLNDFLNKIVKQNKQDIRSDQTIHYQTMTMVESRLRQCIESTMPCQHELAAEFNLSISTLKRHFRKVYGKNTFVYYQEKRLALGRTILENEHKTINEVACILGYNKTNSFSKAFKKYFGFLPRELKYSRGMMAS